MSQGDGECALAQLVAAIGAVEDRQMLVEVAELGVGEAAPIAPFARPAFADAEKGVAGVVRAAMRHAHRTSA